MAPERIKKKNDQDREALEAAHEAAFSALLESDEQHKAEMALHKVTKERDAWKADNRTKDKEIEILRKQLGIVEYLQKSPIITPDWAVPKRGSKPRGTALFMLSDLHLDEVVRPEEMQGVNAFNREIADMRLEKAVTQVPVLAKQFLNSYEYDGAVLILGGDCFSGIIHDELVELNEAPILASLDYWLDPMAAAVELMAEEFKRLLVVGVYGNHGRTNPHKRYKGAAQNNFDWFLYKQLQRHFAANENITWNVPEAPDAYFELYGHKHLVTHGNQANGGSGISGLLTPISLLDHRKRKRDSSIPSIGASSHMWLGHFHQYLPMGQVTINGSLKGYDDFAWAHNFPFEEPQQAFAVITPEHNVTWQTPIFASEGGKKEGW